MPLKRIYSSMSLCLLTLSLTVGGCGSFATPAARSGESTRLARAEARLAALQLRGVDAESYALAEARAWYELALDAQAQGEGGSLVAEALAHIETILQRSECCGGVVDVQAPVLVSRRRPLRQDLWAQLGSMQQHGRFTCAQGDIARLRVQLVAAEHAYQGFGWRHARPYVAAAERYARRAHHKIDNCDGADAEPAVPAVTDRLAPTRFETRDESFDIAPSRVEYR